VLPAREEAADLASQPRIPGVTSFHSEITVVRLDFLQHTRGHGSSLVVWLGPVTIPSVHSVIQDRRDQWSISHGNLYSYVWEEDERARRSS
jgi:hypothetical protein